MLIDLTGKTALVTGASRGLGRAVTLRLIESGASVIAIARDADALAQTEAATGGNADRFRGIACDITDIKATEEMWRNAENEFSGIDILVNNAGAGSLGSISDLGREKLISDYDLKVGAAIRLIQLAIPSMKAKNWGRIINSLSISAKTPAAGTAPTSLSRAAGMALTKAVAGELAACNILVNALCIGFIDSDQWQRMYDQEKPDMSYEDFLVECAKRFGIPMGRMGRAEEFADTVCFLASDKASYITGTAINIDGGASPVL